MLLTDFYKAGSDLGFSKNNLYSFVWKKRKDHPEYFINDKEAKDDLWIALKSIKRKRTVKYVKPIKSDLTDLRFIKDEYRLILTRTAKKNDETIYDVINRIVKEKIDTVIDSMTLDI